MRLCYSPFLPFLFPHLDFPPQESSSFILISDHNNSSAMKFKTTWQMLTERLKKSNFLKMLRRVLFEQSHLSAYLPIVKETLMQKIFRLNDDESTPSDLLFLPHSKQHKTSISKDLADFIFITKTCLDPLSIWLMGWYSLVFASILIIYFTTGMSFIYGL